MSLDLTVILLSDQDMGGSFMFKQVCREGEAYLNRYARELMNDEASFQVYYWGANPNHHDNPLHRHSFFEVCYIVDGEGMYVDDGEEHPLKRGTLFLSRPGVIHQIRSQTGLFILFVAFDLLSSKSGETCRNHFLRLREAERMILSHVEEISAVHLWKALLTEAGSRHPIKNEAMIKSMAHSLLLSFLTAFLEHGDMQMSPIPQSSSILLQRAQLFIRDNLSSPLNLNDVANDLHISGRHLARLFSRELGCTFSQFIRRERIKAATRLLTAGDHTIKEIAEMTGFGSVHYFTRVFSQETRVTPAQYRRRYMGK
ncbi:AraC family transcriptional regulator [Lihuaxuella thermophila]|uniref:AraC-like ligand binding domain-containing protein n=1 Tax=Lihuaxuella thermophila TaxID=1173111 RepID=A0A1H8CD23_9BACL|nr:AraC family transcriptional regulator [Lihuaxuella thermophila]SEM92334.1 AraC-like ligand binding domain-containing protein [Lihuaxuella thermophila]